jgi:hypothetical protein
MSNSKARSDPSWLFIVLLALAVVVLRQWWRASHRLGVPMLSEAGVRAAFPFFIFLALALLVAVLYSLFGKIKANGNRPEV